MNKLMGFYELKHSNLPTIPWKEYDEQVMFDPAMLWTVRTAITRGNDLNLPRAVGVSSEEATRFASELSGKLKDNGMVIYYPYFVAEKSGTLNIFQNKIVIEAVKDDLWNLVTYSDCEVTIIIEDDSTQFVGNDAFIQSAELQELVDYAHRAKKMFREDLLEGKSALLEWSYAYNCDLQKQRLGDKYLVFYEARTV